MKRFSRKKIVYGALLTILIMIVSLPAFRSGVYRGHDLPFHFGRIQAIAEMLKSGQFPVRYEANAWYGYGYICTTMYGNIFLYIPAALFIAGLPLWRVYNIFVILVNVATVLVGFTCFSKIFKSSRYGLLAIYIYTLAGYRLSNVYMRTAVGEFTAMIFIPLVLYGVYKLYFEDKKQNIVARNMPLIIGMTGLVQSHILTTEIISVLLILFAVINIKETIPNIKDILVSVVLTAGINAFFLVPFIDSYSSMDLYINTDLTATSIRADGLYLSQVFGLITKGSGGSYPWTTNDEGYLNTGIVIVLCMILSVVGLVLNRKKKSFKYILEITVVGVLAIWLSTVYFPWDSFVGDSAVAKLMSSVQYPWRYSLIQTVCFTIAGVYGLKAILDIINTDRAAKIININYTLLFVFFAGLSVFATAIFDYTLSCVNETLYNEVAAVDWADKLYLPSGTDRELLKNVEYIVDGDEVTLPVLGYDHVVVEDKNGNALDWNTGENNRIVVKYEGNPDDLTTHFRAPVIWHIAEVVSVICLILLVVFQIYGKKRKIGEISNS
ncbi:hypothetical protein [Pseudobutyrivibrio ruminis]|uniref:hypothetical protein n=1 Tax=Pseudobutyrivibrio ruminis TaxID=46206 RepID=UPI00167109E1|nr:hypothetical protein [Pseudobutyrivibrio ruminis]